MIQGHSEGQGECNRKPRQFSVLFPMRFAVLCSWKACMQATCIRKPFCVGLLSERWLNTEILSKSRECSNSSLLLCASLFSVYFLSFPSLLLISWHLWRSWKTSKAGQPGSRSLLCPPILLQPGVGSRDVSSPSPVSSIVPLHLLSLCECESCSSLR